MRCARSALIPPPPTNCCGASGRRFGRTSASCSAPIARIWSSAPREAYLRRYEIKGVDETTIYPGIDAMLQRIRASGARIYLATTKFVDHADAVLKAFSLRQYFTGVFGARHDGSLGDKRDLLRHIIKEIGIDPARSVMIGDREHDIVGAKANGIHTIGVTYGYGSRAELESAGARCDLRLS